MAKVTLYPAGSEPVEGSLELRAGADEEPTITFEADGEMLTAVHQELGPYQGLLRTTTGIVPYFACRTGNELHLWVAGDTYVFELREVDPEAVGTHSPAGALGDVTAPMPGVIRKVWVTPGQAVEAAAPLVVMESMKMQISLPAPAAGTVTEVLCEEGQMVDLGAVLARIGATAAEDDTT